MSALFAVSHSAPDVRATTRARLTASLASQGFVDQKWFHWETGSLCWYGSGEGGQAQATWVDMDDGFIAQVGTLFYEGLGGAEALRRLWRDFRDPRSICTDRLFGSFLLALAKDGELWLINDRVGMVKLYTVPALGVYSTSWLACVEALDTVRLHEFGAQEYILLGANHGDRTPVSGIGISDPSLALGLIGGGSIPVTTLDDWIGDGTPATIETAADSCTEILRDRLSIIGRALDNKVRCALSGGFDSRLLVAASLSAGIRPDLFVYGAPDDADVRIAGMAASAIELPLRHVDKSQFATSPPPSTPTDLFPVVRFFDGIPPDGLECTGIDRLTRLAQSEEGYVALNGGGGEIMRNFFYLPDRRFTPGQIEQVFYRPYASNVFRSRAACAAFQAQMEASISRLTGPGKLDRPVVELVYPLFRNRYWAGRNNSLAARVGNFLTPLLDPALIILCARLPLSWKNNGRLQSRCIARLNDALARVPLGYGFRPLEGPGRGVRMRSWFERQRPPFVRGNTARLKQLFSRGRKPSPPPFAQVLPWEEVTHLIDPGRLLHFDQLNRALSLEAVRLLVRRTDQLGARNPSGASVRPATGLRPRK